MYWRRLDFSSNIAVSALLQVGTRELVKAFEAMLPQENKIELRQHDQHTINPSNKMLSLTAWLVRQMIRLSNQILLPKMCASFYPPKPAPRTLLL